MPLKEIYCDFMPHRDGKILRSIKTLERINGKSAEELWKEVKAKEKETLSKSSTGPCHDKCSWSAQFARKVTRSLIRPSQQ